MIVQRKIVKALIAHVPFIITGFVVAVMISFSFRSLPVTYPKTLTSYYRYDSAALRLFLQHVKDTNGILVFGTSETASGQKGARYWEIGKVDDRPVYALCGAGHASYTWIPMILKYRELFEGMSVLYYANPVYWSKKLNLFEEDYYRRYFSLNFLSSIDTTGIPQDILARHQKYADYYTDSLVKQTIYPRQFVSDYVDVMSSSISENYKFFLKRYREGKSVEEPYHMVLGTDQEAQWLALYDEAVNLPKNAIHHFPEGLGMIVDDRFQFDALRDFINVAQFSQVDLTVIVGPYNKRLAEKRSAYLMDDYSRVQEEIISLLKSENVPSIDATDLNDRTGVFPDQMHLSNYIGHEAIYKKMKAHYENHGIH